MVGEVDDGDKTSRRVGTACLIERPHASTLDGLSEAVRPALGDDDVGVVEESIDSSSGEALREDRVEPGRVEVRGQDQRSLLVRGVDEAIQSLALVRPSGQQPDVIHDDQLGTNDPLYDLPGRAIDPGTSDRCGQRLEVEPADTQVAVDRRMGDRLGKVGLARPLRSDKDEVLGPTNPVE